ncbi:MAG: hypothetical protein OEV40_10500 [Acidimicrobiia bacterium]|nr:hypothetical protein [Acidimicrobiia bacterium]
MARLCAAWDALAGRHLVGLVVLGASALAVIGASLGLAFSAHADEAGTAVLRWRQIDGRVAAIGSAGRDLVAEVGGPADPAIRADRVRRQGDLIAAELGFIADEVGGEVPRSLEAVADATERLVDAGLAVIEAEEELVRLDAIAELDARSDLVGEAVATVAADLRDRERVEAGQRHEAATAAIGRAAIEVVAIMALLTMLVVVTRRVGRRQQHLETMLGPESTGVDETSPEMATTVGV